MGGSVGWWGGGLSPEKTWPHGHRIPAFYFPPLLVYVATIVYRIYIRIMYIMVYTAVVVTSNKTPYSTRTVPGTRTSKIFLRVRVCTSKLVVLESCWCSLRPLFVQHSYCSQNLGETVGQNSMQSVTCQNKF